ncbi:Dual specificity mitogen-activated protein kinase kinase 4 [Armadillidium nasatum]|uniref:mitogen-activated protein kinase kinase n=1 Tax=Armadillidium nasatum TaxID=96803 RepID=A0A5N5TKC4_9CRUS|nr:Dual specificity mitogen-activated protein kinase kinase 4 [Armadillidium nasatum]
MPFPHSIGYYHNRPGFPGCNPHQGVFFGNKNFRPLFLHPGRTRSVVFRPHFRPPSDKFFPGLGPHHREFASKFHHRTHFGAGNHLVQNPFAFRPRCPLPYRPISNRFNPGHAPPLPTPPFFRNPKISPNIKEYDPYCWANTQNNVRDQERERLSRGFYHNIQLSGKLNISQELQVDFIADDLHDLGEIGRGGFGTVNKMVHRKTNTIMAVKRIRLTVDENEQKQLRDLEVAMWSNDCPFIVQFYGATLKEGDCWICMELMDTSLDKFYKFVYEKLNECIPEIILGKITVATLTALNYLKEKLKLIHRDVKPSNILLDRRGNIKLCDFGISGHLVDSIAKTRDAGCRPYMAPERIDPAQARGYDVRSDVWSLGITLMELATGSFPYPKWNSVFEQLTQVVQGEPPRLNLTENGNTFTEDFVNFVNTCLFRFPALTKEESARPKYRQLLEHPFVLKSKTEATNVAQYVSKILDKMENNEKFMYTYNSYNY